MKRQRSSLSGRTCITSFCLSDSMKCFLSGMFQHLFFYSAGWSQGVITRFQEHSNKFLLVKMLLRIPLLNSMVLHVFHSWGPQAFFRTVDVHRYSFIFAVPLEHGRGIPRRLLTAFPP